MSYRGRNECTGFDIKMCHTLTLIFQDIVMGNLLMAGISIFVPLFNYLITVPLLYHPRIWGGVPWKPPNQVFMGVIREVLNVAMLIVLATISGVMTTERECHKHDKWHSMKRSSWVLLGYLIGNIFAMFVPIAKAPILALSTWL